MTLKKINKYFLNILFGILDGKITDQDFKYYIYRKDKEADSESANTVCSNIRILGSWVVSFLEQFDFYNLEKDNETYLEKLGKHFRGLLNAYITLFTSVQSLDISFSGQKLGTKASEGFNTFPEDGSVPLLASKILVEYSMYDSGIGGSIVYIIKEAIDGLKIEVSPKTKYILNATMDEANKNRPFNVGTILSNFKKRLQEENIL